MRPVRAHGVTHPTRSAQAVASRTPMRSSTTSASPTAIGSRAGAAAPDGGAVSELSDASEPLSDELSAAVRAWRRRGGDDVEAALCSLAAARLAMLERPARTDMAAWLRCEQRRRE